MSRTLKAIERHMTPPSKREAVEHAPKFVGEWQQRGPETILGFALRKLRLVFGASQSTKLATTNQ